MNKLTLSFIAAIVSLIFSYNVNAQAPQKMTYQAVIRNSGNQLLTNQSVGMQVSILQGSATGTPVYVETQTPSSNANGLVTIEIGNGTVVSGNFSTINWANGPYFIKTETDPTGGTNYTITGTSQLLSVPYALYAKSAGSISGTAGGDLTGTYPNPNIAANAVSTPEIANGAVISAKIGTGEVKTTNIDVGAVTGTKINQMSATSGQVLKWNGVTWAPATDNSAGSYVGGVGITITGNTIDNDLGTNISTTELQNIAVTTTKIANNAVTSAKIGAGEVKTSNIDAGAVTSTKINQMAATSGQVLKWNGSAWAPSTDNTSGNYIGGVGITITGNTIDNDLGTDISTVELQNYAVTGTKINQMSATNGQVLEWNGSQWTPALDDTGNSSYTGGVGITITGNTINNDLGTDISTSELQNSAVTSAKIANNAVTTAKLNNGAVIGAKINQMSATTGQVLKWNGSQWMPAGDSSGFNGWSLIGNAGTDTSNFIGTTDNEPLRFKQNNKAAGYIDSTLTVFGIGALGNNTTGSYNTAFGTGALQFNTTGIQNTAIGVYALDSNTTGNFNTASGYGALFANTTGYNNTANGTFALYYNTSGYYNTAIGKSALQNNTNGDYNTAIGNKSLYANTTGKRNTASGVFALYSNTTGNRNSANGYRSLYFNTTGADNAATGNYALRNNTTGNENTAVGSYALWKNTTADNNTAVGFSALFSDTTGYNNTAIGKSALYANSSGDENTAIGVETLYSNTTGNQNTAIGKGALYSNTTGISNTATGYHALYNSTIGANNAAFGRGALYYLSTGSGNTAIGKSALTFNTSGHYNTAVGYLALSGLSGNVNNNCGFGYSVDISDNSSNSMALGYNAYVVGSNKVVVGNSSITSIGGYANWSNLSDARFKTEMRPLEHGLDFIMKLKPITYHMNLQKLHNFIEKREGEAEEKAPEWLEKSIVKKAAIQYSGFSAQQVEKAAKSIGYNFSGVHAPDNELDHYTLAYAEFVVPLVKAVQEQQVQIEKQQERITAQNDKIKEQQKVNEQQKATNQKLQARVGELERILKSIEIRLEALVVNK